MDDAELQRLPQEMQDEARRARVHHFDPVCIYFLKRNYVTQVVAFKIT